MREKVGIAVKGNREILVVMALSRILTVSMSIFWF